MTNRIVESGPITLPKKEPANAFAYCDDREPHIDQARAMMRAHPEVRSLAGPEPVTGLVLVFVAALQLGIAWLLRDSAWWLIVAASWLVGAYLIHGLWVLIHECVHNLVFRNPRYNLMLLLFGNLPIIVPAASSFRKYHLIHHRHQGDPTIDGDLPTRWEARLIGHGFIGKIFWMFNFWLFQTLRVLNMKRAPFLDATYVANFLIQVAFTALLLWLVGPKAVTYLFLSAILSVGLHPVGARWIQEHFLVKPDQETYSYYGVLNLLSFNIGYHNEHHDAPGVAWMHLPKVRRIAPEIYDRLYAHRSWTRLWLRFLFDPSMSLFDRMTRRDGREPAATATAMPAE